MFLHLDNLMAGNANLGNFAAGFLQAFSAASERRRRTDLRGEAMARGPGRLDTDAN